ncbi:hypothetical protein N9H39_08605 [Gammaproteobacteria bacterium]|nr:hypothetical protein [Gammaproteobacteria bacterium]
MILSALIKKGGLAQVSRATPATVATQDTDQAATVAPVATVAVAEKPKQPLDPEKRLISSELSVEEESRVRAWLAHIKETKPDEIAKVLDDCRIDSGARAYFLRRAEEVPKGKRINEPDKQLKADARETR